jgi:phosphoglycolate phosphatase-like HAD superfamily hydrolase
MQGRVTKSDFTRSPERMGSSEPLATLLAEVSEEASSQAEQHHSEHYRQSSELLRAFDGARDLVAAVAHRGVSVVLATSAAPDELELLRSVLGIDDAVAQITAAEAVRATKPQPDLIHVALQQAGVTAGWAVYVGDTVWDAKDCGAVAVYQECQALLCKLDTSPLAAVWS